jgi:cytochrome P450
MEMTLVVAMLVQRFTLRPAPGQSSPAVKMQVTLRPAGGMRLVFAEPAPARTGAAACPFHG